MNCRTHMLPSPADSSSQHLVSNGRGWREGQVLDFGRCHTPSYHELAELQVCPALYAIIMHLTCRVYVEGIGVVQVWETSDDSLSDQTTLDGAAEVYGSSVATHVGKGATI
jgi:hypothetical protein